MLLATERARRPAAMLVALAMLAGCGSGGQPPGEPPDQRAKLLTIPDEYKILSNPLAATEANLNKGRARYEQYCAACHGPDGKADTALGLNLYPRASDLTSAHVQQHTDGQLYWIVSEGIRYSGMPAGRKLHSEDQIWQIVLYLRQLSGGVPNSPEHPQRSRVPEPLQGSAPRKPALQ